MLEANALGSCWHYGTRHRRDHRGGAEAAAQDVACLRDGEQGTVRRAFDQSWSAVRWARLAQRVGGSARRL